MADPIDLAAEEMAPSRPATSFFEKHASPVFRAASAGRSLDDQRILGEEIGGLGESRFQRRLRRREEALMDRDELEFEAKQSFMASRGDFLSQISLIDATSPSYGQERADLIASLPPEALKDDAVRAILKHKDSQALGRAQQLEDEQRNERILQRGRQEMIEDARAEFFRRGGDEETFRGFFTEDGRINVDRLMGGVGELEREQEGAVKGLSRTEQEDQLDKFLAEPGVFRSAVDREFEKWKPTVEKKINKTFDKFKKTEEYEKALRRDKISKDDAVALAARMNEDEFVEHFSFEGLSEEGKEWLRQTYRVAKGLSPLRESPEESSSVPAVNAPLDQTKVKVPTTFGG